MTIQGDSLNNGNRDIKLAMQQFQDSHSVTGKDGHGPAGSFNGVKFNSPVKRRSDYSFKNSKGFGIVKNAILNDSKDCSYLTDHFPVYVELYVVD